jgi:NADPH-dependent glutamate synthase beta subunit-like oxidoreductase
VPTAQRPRPPPKKLNPVRVSIAEEEAGERAFETVEVLHPYSREAAIQEAQRCVYCAKPWCIEACPLAQDCREYVTRIGEGDFDGAAELIVRDNPLASTLARVCYHYCEESCVIAKKGSAVAVRHLKRAALEYGNPRAPYARETAKAGRVAVVGAGPAGLMVAWSLAQKGFGVDVYEGRDILGGLVTLTIPPYRLPREAFEEDIARMRDLGIRFKMDIRLGKDLTLEDLRKGYDAVFLGIGTHKPQTVKIDGSELPGVHLALRLLEDAVRGRQVRIGERVAVIGGGDVAMDSARMALRLGANEVTIVYRRSRREMPASPEEAAEAEAEGVKFQFLVAPLRIEGEDGHVRRLVCQRMELGAPDESGRRRPVPIPGSEYAMPVDDVVLAIGQVADISGVPNAAELGITVDKEGIAIGIDAAGRTKLEDVFVGGGTSVVHAMAAGKRSAAAIEERLKALGKA